jgi:hypothetical protein
VIGFSKILEEVKSRAALPGLQIDLLPTANQNFFHALMLNRRGFQDWIAVAISTGAQDMLCILKRSRHRGPKLIDSLRSLNRPRLNIGVCMDEATRGISAEGTEISDHVHLVKISEVVTNV